MVHNGAVAAQRMTALVVEADHPLDNLFRQGSQSHGLVRILAGTPAGTVCVGRRFRLDRDHWPVRGMHLAVWLDPSSPEQFEIAWDELPGIEDRVARGDPALADPIRARTATLRALEDAGVPVGSDARAAGLVAQAAALQSGAGVWSPEGFDSALAEAARLPAPDGKERALVVIATSLATLRTQDDGRGSSMNWYHDIHGKHDAVLAVYVPGRAPYALSKHKFKHKRGRGMPRGGGLPALVSLGDPADVEVLWDELPSLKEQNRQTVAAAYELRDAQLAQAMQPWGAAAPPAPGGVPQMGGDAQSMMAQNARAALAAVQDPAMRQMLIAQYRAMGIQIDDAG